MAPPIPFHSLERCGRAGRLLRQPKAERVFLACARRRDGRAAAGRAAIVAARADGQLCAQPVLLGVIKQVGGVCKGGVGWVS